VEQLGSRREAMGLTAMGSMMFLKLNSSRSKENILFYGTARLPHYSTKLKIEMEPLRSTKLLN
jgi:hypothetical protein